MGGGSEYGPHADRRPLHHQSKNGRRAIYAAYFSGKLGQSFALFFIGEGKIAGVDAAGVKYTGVYSKDHEGALDINLSFMVKAGADLITGHANPEQDASIPVHVLLPPNFEDGRVIRIDTMVGPLNARFEELQRLGD